MSGLFSEVMANFFLASILVALIGFLLCRFRPILILIVLPAVVLMLYDRVMKMVLHPPDQEVDPVFIVKYLVSILLPLLGPLAGALITWTKKGS